MRASSEATIVRNVENNVPYEPRIGTFGSVVVLGFVLVACLLIYYTYLNVAYIHFGPQTTARETAKFVNRPAFHPRVPDENRAPNDRFKATANYANVVIDRNVNERVHFFNACSESREIQESVMKNKCVRFITPTRKDAKICVYSAELDMYISKNLITSGTWERELVFPTGSILTKHPGMSFVDLGCNIGVFTLYSAALGRKVVSVDANKENLLLLSRSLDLNDLHPNVTLVWNALSDVHENVILKGFKANVGGAYVAHTNQTNLTSTVKTILLDDLQPLFGKGDIFIKMDIETYEWRALKGGRKFFENLNVKYVLLEFTSHREAETGKQICGFMSSYGFQPYKIDNLRYTLNESQYKTWPDNVLWIKSET